MTNALTAPLAAPTGTDAAQAARRQVRRQARLEALIERAERARRRKASGFAKLARWAGDAGPAPGRCQWLHGDGPFTDADKCGRPSERGRPYCRAHLARAHVPAMDDEGTAAKGCADD